MAVWEQQQNSLNRGCMAFIGDLATELTVPYNNGNGCYVSDRFPVDEFYESVYDAAAACDLDYTVPIDDACLLAIGGPSGVVSMRTFLFFDGLTVPRSSNIVSATLTLWMEVRHIYTINQRQFFINAEDSATMSYPTKYASAMEKVLTSTSSAFLWDKLSIWSSGTDAHKLSNYTTMQLNDLEGNIRTFAEISFDITSLIQYLVLKRRWKNPNTLLLCQEMGSAIDSGNVVNFLGYSSTFSQYAPRLQIVHDQQTVVLMETSKTTDKWQHNHAELAATSTIEDKLLDNWPEAVSIAEAYDEVRGGIQRDVAIKEEADGEDTFKGGFQLDDAVAEVATIEDTWKGVFYIEFNLNGTLEYVTFSGELALSLTLEGAMQYVKGAFEISSEAYDLTAGLEYVTGAVTFGKAFVGTLERLDCAIALAPPATTFSIDTSYIDEVVTEGSTVFLLGKHLAASLSYMEMTSELTLGLQFSLSAATKPVTGAFALSIPKFYYINGKLPYVVFAGTVSVEAFMQLEASLETVTGHFALGKQVQQARFGLRGILLQPTMSVKLASADGSFVMAAEMLPIAAIVSIWNDNSDEELLKYKDRL